MAGGRQTPIIRFNKKRIKDLNITAKLPPRTNVQILLDPTYQWESFKIQATHCHLKGSLFWEGRPCYGLEAAQKIVELFSGVNGAEEIARRSNSLSGFFAIILESPGSIIALTDKVRSYPIFYTSTPTGVSIGNSARGLQRAQGRYQWNPEGRIEFQMTGFVTGNETLIDALYQLPAGRYIAFDTTTQTLEMGPYYTFYTPQKPEKTTAEWIDALDAQTMTTFKETLKAVDGRPIWIPLSGGLDSRLILGMLKYLGYKDITTFSYGPPGNWEARVARQVSEHLKVKWLFKAYNHKTIARMYRSNTCDAFLRFADGLSVVPFHGDFYALCEFIEQKEIPRDAVIINGQTGDFISGGHIPAAATTHFTPKEERIAQAIFAKHYALWLDLTTPANQTLMESRIRRILPTSSGLITPQHLADGCECWEWQERQAKFVVNGQRVYDFLNFKWHLPLWSEQYLRFWHQVPLHLKREQKLYRLYLTQKNPMGLFTRKWTPQYPTPRYLPVLSLFTKLIARYLGKDQNRLTNKYLRYFMYTGPLYSFIPYRTYLKRSEYHRNVVSYRVYETLQRIETT